MPYIYVKLFEIRTSGSGGDVVKKKVYAQQTHKGRWKKTNHNSSP